MIFVLTVAGCSVRQPSTVSNAAPASTRDLVIHGVVRDYRGELVAGARVSAVTVVTVITDAAGRFELAVPVGTHVSASQSDMYGSIEIRAGDRDVVIVMAQMPM